MLSIVLPNSNRTLLKPHVDESGAPMRMAIFAQGIYPYSPGGMQKHSYNLARFLAREGVQVDLYYALYPEEASQGDLRSLLTEEEAANITLTQVERPRTPYFPGHFILNSYQLSKAIYAAFAPTAAGVDFIYAQGFAGWEAIRQRKAGADVPPIGVNFHGLESYQKTASPLRLLQHLMLRPFIAYNIRSADYGLSLGGGLTRILNDVGLSPPRIIRSPNGIPPDWQHENDQTTTDDALTFLFVGVYHRRKGVQELQQALRALPPDVHFSFEFVGKIPEKYRLALPRIRYLGFVDEDELRAAFRRADVLVCPSYSEGMPTVILEAMSSETAVIATQVGAVDELVNDRNGWLVPPGDERALRNALLTALQAEPAVLARMKREGAVHARSFHWDAVAQTTLQGIKEKLNASAAVQRSTV